MVLEPHLEPNLSDGEIPLQVKEYSDTFLNTVVRLSDGFLKRVDSLLTKALIIKIQPMGQARSPDVNVLVPLV